MHVFDGGLKYIKKKYWLFFKINNEWQQDIRYLFLCIHGVMSIECIKVRLLLIAIYDLEKPHHRV